VERWNRVNSGFDYTSKNPLSDQIIARWNELKDSLRQDQSALLVSRPTCRHPRRQDLRQRMAAGRIYDTDWQNIQPRIGIAWRFQQRTVLRTGFGIYHRTATQAGQTDGFSQNHQLHPLSNGDISPAATGLTGPYSLQNRSRRHRAAQWPRNWGSSPAPVMP